jgi:hypothetical protein
MADQSVPMALLSEIYDAIVNRDARDAARRAGSLKFWRDGMLDHLKAIADGRATSQTYKRLGQQFLDSQKDVNRAVERLRQLRDRIGGARISDQIDRILNDSKHGKLEIRENVRNIIAWHRREDVTAMARQACDDIETLNAEIDRLHRMVYDT